jgi:hypothetical protein
MDLKTIPNTPENETNLKNAVELKNDANFTLSLIAKQLAAQGNLESLSPWLNELQGTLLTAQHTDPQTNENIQWAAARALQGIEAPSNPKVTKLIETALKKGKDMPNSVRSIVELAKQGIGIDNNPIGQAAQPASGQGNQAPAPAVVQGQPAAVSTQPVGQPQLQTA